MRARRPCKAPALTALPAGRAQDLAKDSAPHYKAGRKVFDALALQLVAQGHSLDVFACSLDQAGPSPEPLPLL